MPDHISLDINSLIGDKSWGVSCSPMESVTLCLVVHGPELLRWWWHLVVVIREVLCGDGGQPQCQRLQECLQIY